MHYPDSGNLTGTVSITNGSTTVTGSGTSFTNTSQINVGQVITVSSQKRVVTAIASDTSLTVATAFTTTASGQTATKVNSAIVFQTAGKFRYDALALFDANVSMKAEVRLKDSTVIATIQGANGGVPTGYAIGKSRVFAQWDFIELLMTQTGGTYNISPLTTFEARKIN
jgi:hypothetical protein